MGRPGAVARDDVNVFYITGSAAGGKSGGNLHLRFDF
jgi:hypothetical protein